MKGKCIVFAGTLCMKRAEAQALATENGASIASRISRTTDIVVEGRDAGDTVDRARSMGIAVLSEREFLQAVEASGADWVPDPADSGDTVRHLQRWKTDSVSLGFNASTIETVDNFQLLQGGVSAQVLWEVLTSQGETGASKHILCKRILARLQNSVPNFFSRLADEVEMVASVAISTGKYIDTPLRACGCDRPPLQLIYSIRGTQHPAMLWTTEVCSELVDADEFTATCQLDASRNFHSTNFVSIRDAIKGVWDEELAWNIREDPEAVEGVDWGEVWSAEVVPLLSNLLDANIHHQGLYIQDLSTFWENGALNERFLFVYGFTPLGNLVGVLVLIYNNV